MAFVWMDFDSKGIPFSVMNELERAIEESSSMKGSGERQMLER